MGGRGSFDSPPPPTHTHTQTHTQNKEKKRLKKSGQLETTYLAVTGRKRTLFHCMWASYISRMLY